MKKIALDELISTFFGIGRYGKMPGTLGSLAALIIAVIIPVHWTAIITVILIGTWFSDRYSKRTGIKDPSEVVIDEVAGMWVSMYALPASYWVPAFVLFRVFDILKPFPVSMAEKLPGGVGIMADDIVAGVMVNLILLTTKAFIM